MAPSPALLDTLASYVPARIVRRAAPGCAPPTTPVAEQFEAAVFFADISGFTQMAERLGQSGPSGTEELRRLINVYFDELIALIVSHGGDIIKFAGDRCSPSGPPARTARRCPPSPSAPRSARSTRRNASTTTPPPRTGSSFCASAWRPGMCWPRTW